MADTSLGTVETVAFSGVTGAGLDELRAALDRLVAALPAPDRAAPVRLWVDRSFSIRGSGTVVTGTLGAGSLRVGDELELAGGRQVRVRGLQSLGAPAPEVTAVARVAVNLRGVELSAVRRGDALVTPGRFGLTGVVDVRLAGDPAGSLPPTVTLHAGSAAVPVRVRPLGADTARLGLSTRLPLRIGDRALLRDPGRHHVIGGATVLDVAPPPLRRRGSAAARAAELSTMDGVPSEADEVRRRGLVRRADLVRMGVEVTGTPVAGDWLADPARWSALRQRLASLVARHAAEHPLEHGVPVEALRQALDLPDRSLVDALVASPLGARPLVARSGRVALAGQGGTLPAPVARAVERVRADLAGNPFRAPDTGRLAELGLGPRELAAAVRAGALLRVADGVVLLPGAPGDAVTVLARLPQPFTLSAAREALGTTRRVAVPLLELLDRQGATRRLPDDRRMLDGSGHTLAGA
jgi:selenocysteine-specific elongation factor